MLIVFLETLNPKFDIHRIERFRGNFFSLWKEFVQIIGIWEQTEEHINSVNKLQIWFFIFFQYFLPIFICHPNVKVSLQGNLWTFKNSLSCYYMTHYLHCYTFTSPEEFLSPFFWYKGAPTHQKQVKGIARVTHEEHIHSMHITCPENLLCNSSSIFQTS